MSYRWGKTPKNLTQETFPDWGSKPGTLCVRRACYHLVHSGGLWTLPKFTTEVKYEFLRVFDQLKDPEIPITLRPVYWRGYLKEEDAGRSIISWSQDIYDVMKENSCREETGWIED